VTPAVRYTPSDLRDATRLWSGDVVVVGGGSAGCAAAVAAARTGAETLLVESGGFLGGTGARVLDSFYGFYAPGEGNVRVLGGIPWEVCEALTARGMAFERPSTYGAGTAVTYEPEALKRVWETLVLGAGARLLLHARMTAVVMDASAVVGLVVETTRGPARVDARAVIDASGDAEVALRAGAALDRLDRVQPCTTTFRMGNVAAERASRSELRALMAAAHDYALPRREGSIHETVLPGVQHANMTRVAAIDPTDPWQLTAAEVEGRAQVEEYARFLRERVPGYEQAFLLQTSPRIGVRESRRLVGEYVLTREDVLGARGFPDGIARCGAPIEDHDEGGATRWEYIPDGGTYAIPWRCLLPREIEGLVVAGRCLSATHDAHASVRSMGQCMAMGQAAGTAAALAGADVRDLDPVRLRERLAADGVLL
jgi:2-polyprenyl-6-methoxyphenol hydroxylase-like FAD-dependent oxidoreductase